MPKPERLPRYNDNGNTIFAEFPNSRHYVKHTVHSVQSSDVRDAKYNYQMVGLLEEPSDGEGRRNSIILCYEDAVRMRDALNHYICDVQAGRIPLKSQGT